MGKGFVGAVPVEAVTGVARMIYGELRAWLYEEAKKTETPVDEWMLRMLDGFFGFFDEPGKE